VTGAARSALDQARAVYLRTTRHPTAELAPPGTTSFDRIYEEADTFDEVYRRIADELIATATTDGVVYAVPGSPLVLERSVRYLREDPRIDVELIPSLSFLDEAWARLTVDPIDAGVRLVDGHRFAVEAAGERGPLLVAHVHAPWVLSSIKLALDSADADLETPVVVLQRLGTDTEQVSEISWEDLDRVVEPDHLTTLYLPELAVPVARELARTVETMHRLRQECPWDRAQDHHSLRRYLIEETYELLEAIDALGPGAGAVLERPASGGDPGPGSGLVAGAGTDDGAVTGGDRAGTGGDGAGTGEDGPVPVDADPDGYAHLEEELGDVWMQVLFHAELATEAGQFTIADVARGLHDKLVARHPHVFDDVEVRSAEEVRINWERIKSEEKRRTSPLDGIPPGLPALALADKILSRLDRVGVAIEPTRPRDGAGELDESSVGRQLLAVVADAHQVGVDPEQALRVATAALADRFNRGELTGRWVAG
jgi:tetrapyrrole methylase family protein/MazG family protein